MSDPARAADLITLYARTGAKVFPLHTPVHDTRPNAPRCSCGHTDCRNVGKHPRTRNGKDDATNDLGVIAEWLARWPDANWGLAVAPGYIVIDVDPRNGGDTTLADLEAHHGDLPATLTCRTGSGGWHIWLRHDGPRRGRIGAGLDIKYQGGYLVVPPSRHAAGGTYEWVDTSRVAEAPLWVRDKLAPPPRAALPARTGGRDRITGLVDWVAAAGEGERNNRLYWAACRAREDGVDPTPLIAAAESTGTPFHEAAATVESPARRATRAETTDHTRWRWRDHATR